MNKLEQLASIALGLSVGLGADCALEHGSHAAAVAILSLYCVNLYIRSMEVPR